jgi:hypothetical protein
VRSGNNLVNAIIHTNSEYGAKDAIRSILLYIKAYIHLTDVVLVPGERLNQKLWKVLFDKKNWPLTKDPKKILKHSEIDIEEIGRYKEISFQSIEGSDIQINYVLADVDRMLRVFCNPLKKERTTIISYNYLLEKVNEPIKFLLKLPYGVETVSPIVLPYSNLLSNIKSIMTSMVILFKNKVNFSMACMLPQEIKTLIPITFQLTKQDKLTLQFAMSQLIDPRLVPIRGIEHSKKVQFTIGIIQTLLNCTPQASYGTYHDTVTWIDSALVINVGSHQMRLPNMRSGLVTVSPDLWMYISNTKVINIDTFEINNEFKYLEIPLFSTCNLIGSHPQKELLSIKLMKPTDEGHILIDGQCYIATSSVMSLMEMHQAIFSIEEQNTIAVNDVSFNQDVDELDDVVMESEEEDL